MEAIHLFSLASQKSNWLSVRQAAIAENVSHVNTPGPKARDVQPFSEVMDRTRLMMAATNAAHLELDGQPRSHDARKADSWTITHSGNSVSVEQGPSEELMMIDPKGQASVQQVVEAVMSAEQSLQTALAVRDKVVAAYQEISRMQI